MYGTIARMRALNRKPIHPPQTIIDSATIVHEMRVLKSPEEIELMQRAADIAKYAGLITANDRWCELHWLTMDSKAQPNIHVLRDAILAAPLMPKSGHMANQHGKVAAAAIINLLKGLAHNPTPMVVNTCYSFVED